MFSVQCFLRMPFSQCTLDWETGQLLISNNIIHYTSIYLPTYLYNYIGKGALNILIEIFKEAKIPPGSQTSLLGGGPGLSAT